MPLVAAKPPKPTSHVVKLQIDRAAPGTITTKLYSGPPAIGNVEVSEVVFLDAQGNKFSSEGGVWTRVRLPEVWHAVVVHKWPDGDLTVHLLTDFDDPIYPHRFAITGGTGDYLGAYGQIEYNSDTDITFRFWVP
jgi:hypothetical protein